MVRCEMSIAHRHLDISVSKDTLQYKNVTPAHNKVACKCMP